MNIEDTRQACEKIHERDHWQCRYIESGNRCPSRSEEIAHGISKGKTGRQKVNNFLRLLYGKRFRLNGAEMDLIIHHPLNVWASCRKHNDYFLISSYEPFKKKVIEIKNNLDKINET